MPSIIPVSSFGIGASAPDRQPPAYGRGGAPAQGSENPWDVLAARTGERSALNFRQESFDYSLSIEDGSGRKATFNFSMDSTIATASYDRFGTIVAAKGAPGDRGREFSAESLMAQHYHYREEVTVEQVNWEASIEGDAELIEDYFSAENTANRIMDFGKSLFAMHSGKMNEDSDADYAKNQIAQGLRQGFEQAKEILGELAEVSKQTINLVEDMLNQWMNPEDDELEA